MSIEKKQETVTFKVDPDLWHALQGISNRSEFIRSAVQSALENVCPVCHGSGRLTSEQREALEVGAEATGPLTDQATKEPGGGFPCRNLPFI